MKRLWICAVVVMLSLFILTSCNPTQNWKTVKIEGYGNIKVPKNWEYSADDGFATLSSGDRPILIQYSRVNDKGDDMEYNEYFADIEDMIWVYDENYSNSAGIIRYKVCYRDGTSEERYVLDFYGPEINLTEFICVDDSISEDILKDITKSFTCLNY